MIDLFRFYFSLPAELMLVSAGTFAFIVTLPISFLNLHAKYCVLRASSVRAELAFHAAIASAIREQSK